MRWYMTAIVGFGCSLLALNWLLVLHDPERRRFSAASWNISHAFLISLAPQPEPASLLQSTLNLPSVELFRAFNSTNVALDSLPLYTRHIINQGRSDHMQLPNREALACLLSHAALWSKIVDLQAPAFIFEEDILVTESTSTELEELFVDMKSLPYEILMLDPGHLNSEGVWNHVGKTAANCSKRCIWFGTRAYLLTPRGAAVLLKYLEPISVQVDAYITLMATFHPTNFRMYWARRQIFPLNLFRASTIFDGCIKCYMPMSVLFYILLALLWCIGAWKLVRTKKRSYFVIQQHLYET